MWKKVFFSFTKKKRKEMVVVMVVVGGWIPLSFLFFPKKNPNFCSVVCGSVRLLFFLIIIYLSSLRKQDIYFSV